MVRNGFEPPDPEEKVVYGQMDFRVVQSFGITVFGNSPLLSSPLLSSPLLSCPLLSSPSSLCVIRSSHHFSQSLFELQKLSPVLDISHLSASLDFACSQILLVPYISYLLLVPYNFSCYLFACPVPHFFTSLLPPRLIMFLLMSLYSFCRSYQSYPCYD